jgi:hypothetical protein
MQVGCMHDIPAQWTSAKLPSEVTIENSKGARPRAVRQSSVKSQETVVIIDPFFATGTCEADHEIGR